MKPFIYGVALFYILSFAEGCIFKKRLQPLPVVNSESPDVWTSEQCRNVPKAWFGIQGQDPSKVWDGWHCDGWKIYEKSVAP